MAKNFLDYDGLLYFWQSIKTKLAGKVDVVSGKGLSTNDYTTDDKNKLAGIESGANKTTINNTLTSTSATEALAAAQGKVLNDKIAGILDDIGSMGGGDMMKATYDPDGDGIVDNAEKLGGQLPSYYAAAADIPTTVSQLTDAGNYALKTDITNVYKYKGSKSTVSDLPSSGNTAGDVWNVEATNMNYAWTGSAWDPLGEVFTIESISNSDIDTIMAS